MFLCLHFSLLGQCLLQSPKESLTSVRLSPCSGGYGYWGQWDRRAHGEDIDISSSLEREDASLELRFTDFACTGPCCVCRERVPNSLTKNCEWVEKWTEQTLRENRNPAWRLLQKSTEGCWGDLERNQVWAHAHECKHMHKHVHSKLFHMCQH